MPKVSNAFLDQQNHIRGWIQYGKVMHKLKHDELAKRIAMPPTTLSYRIAHPETFRLEEFWRLEKVIGDYKEF